MDRLIEVAEACIIGPITNEETRLEVLIELLAIVKKLPQTADNVPVTGQGLYHPCGTAKFDGVHRDIANGEWVCEYRLSNSGGTTPEYCYSTPEAAEAARDKT